jgi:hypothetical protein
LGECFVLFCDEVGMDQKVERFVIGKFGILLVQMDSVDPHVPARSLGGVLVQFFWQWQSSGSTYQLSHTEFLRIAAVP